MDQFDLMERQHILGFALTEAYRQMKTIQDQITNLESEQTKYQDMIDNIRGWQDELKDELKEII